MWFVTQPMKSNWGQKNEELPKCFYKIDEHYRIALKAVNFQQFGS